MRIPKKTVALTLATTLLAGSAFADDKRDGGRESADTDERRPAPEVGIDRHGFDIAKMMAELGIDENDVRKMAQGLQGEEGEALAEMAAAFMQQMMAGDAPRRGRHKPAETDEKRPDAEIEVAPRGFDIAKLMQGLGIDENDVMRMAQGLQGEDGKALAEMAAGVMGQMMSGDGKGDLSFDLSPLFGEDGGLSDALSSALSAALKESVGDDDPKAGITMMGKGVIIGPDGVRHEIDFGKDGAGLRELDFELRDREDGDAEEDDAVVEMLMEISEQLDLQAELLKLLIEKIDK